jgi:hypothetical protein
LDVPLAWGGGGNVSEVAEDAIFSFSFFSFLWKNDGHGGRAARRRLAGHAPALPTRSGAPADESQLPAPVSLSSSFGNMLLQAGAEAGRLQAMSSCARLRNPDCSAGINLPIV